MKNRIFEYILILSFIFSSSYINAFTIECPKENSMAWQEAHGQSGIALNMFANVKVKSDMKKVEFSGDLTDADYKSMHRRDPNLLLATAKVETLEDNKQVLLCTYNFNTYDGAVRTFTLRTSRWSEFKGCEAKEKHFECP